MFWPKALIKQIKTGLPLAKYTTFKIGGKAKFYFEPSNRRQLSQALEFAARNKLPVFTLGAGSNILISDRGVDGLVIRLSHADFKRISVRGRFIRCACAVSLSKLAQAAQRGSLSGGEFLVGIPGSLGGGLLMNAGAWGSSIADIVEEIEVMGYNGKIKVLKRNSLKFGYRCSGLKNYVILSAKLKFSPKDKSAIERLMRQYLLKRLVTQKTRLANAGCIFKNPVGCSAGKLIDLCGLKGVSRGKAVVAQKHANFILNRGGAKSADVLELMRFVRKSVKAKFKINLQPEIKVWS